MSAPLQWVFELIDKMSGPAEHIEGAVGKATGALEKSERAGKHAGGGMRDAAESFFFIGEAAHMAFEGLSKIVEKGLEFGDFVVEAASFKRNTVAALELLEGTPDAARRTFDEIAKFAEKSPLSKDLAIGLFRKLRNEEFNSSQSEDILAAAADIGQAHGGAGADAASAEFVALIGKVRGGDKLDKKVVKALLEASGGALTQKDIVAQLAEARHISDSAATALLKGGTVKGDEGVRLLLEATQRKLDKGGPLGQYAQTLGEQSFEVQTQKVKDAIKSLVEDTDISPLVGSLKKVSEALGEDTESGQKLRKMFSDATSSVGAWIEKNVTAESIGDAIDKIVLFGANASAVFSTIFAYSEAFLGPVIGKIGRVAGASEAIKGPDEASVRNVERFSKGLVAIGSGAVWFVTAIPPVRMLIDGVGTLVSTVGMLSQAWDDTLRSQQFAEFSNDVSDVLNEIPQALEDFGSDIQQAIHGIPDALGDLGSLLYDAGTDMIAGMWQGITDRWDDLMADLQSLADKLPEPVRKALDSHSPSRKFALIGADMMRGIAVGADEEAANTNAVVGAAVATSVSIPRTTAASSAGSPSARGPLIGELNINITLGANAGSDARSLAAQIARELELQLPLVLEQALAEAGAIEAA